MQKALYQEHIIEDPVEYYERMVALINNAKDSIYLESYIFEDDFVGQSIAEALENAALRGVVVEILVDGVGAGVKFASIAQQLTQCGATVKVFRPLPWRIELWPFSTFPHKGLEKLWYLSSYINRRNHRKVLIVDTESVLLGSLNICKDHLPSELGGKGFRDVAIEVTGADFKSLQSDCQYAWDGDLKRKPTLHLKHNVFRFNFTRTLRKLSRKTLDDMLENAKDSILISNAYFIPDSKLLKSLTNASKRGVDVRILVPGRSDIFFIPYASSTFYSTLLNAGIRVYELNDKVLHCKTLIIDQWASIGSSNLNTRSFMHDLELDYTIQNEETRLTLSNSLIEDYRSSRELSIHTLESQKPWHPIIGSILLFLFSYWV